MDNVRVTERMGNGVACAWDTPHGRVRLAWPKGRRSWRQTYVARSADGKLEYRALTLENAIAALVRQADGKEARP